jgi:hypothetical protein
VIPPAGDNTTAAKARLSCLEPRDTSAGSGWQTACMSRRSAVGEEGDLDAAGPRLSEEELILRATADRAAGRDGTIEIEALLLIAADQNQAALDRLAK